MDSNMTLILDGTDGVCAKAGIPVGSLLRPFDELIFIYDNKGADFEIPLGDFCNFVEAFLFGPDTLTQGDCIQRMLDFVSYVHVESGATVRIPVDDFEALVKYVLTCSDLMTNDSRKAFLSRLVVEDRVLLPGRENLYNWLATLEEVPGWNVPFGRDTKRLGHEETADI